MITLYHFGSFQSLPDPSPFCLKVDVYLRMTGIPFTCSSGAHNLRRAPKGKLPFIEDNGKIIADSAIILDYLKQTYGDKLDAHLTAEQKAVSHAVIKMLDENLYWCMPHSRWIDGNVWPGVCEEIFGGLPIPLKQIISRRARNQVRKALLSQGTGRHSDHERLEIARRDLDALSGLLGGKTYFFGDQPSALDAVAYAFVAEMIIPWIEHPLNRLAKSYANLSAHCERIRVQYYKTQQR